MRQPRIKIDDQPTWYHCYNRVAGTENDRPFGNPEKEQFVRILKRVAELYTVQVISYQIMSNHFHLLVYAPVEEPSAEEMCQRFARFHRGKRTLSPDSPTCKAWQARSRDISWFMRHLQHLFTAWYNRTRPVRRRGSLWADRYKNTLLESGKAVWACWAYIENNAVRAGMVDNAADYRYGSHGVWHQTGRHPFANNLKATALPMLQTLLGIFELSEIRARLDQVLGCESTADDQCHLKGFTLTVHRRVRYWTNGLVIGSRLYLREVMARHRDEDELRRHRTARAQAERGAAPSLYAWRTLRDIELA